MSLNREIQFESIESLHFSANLEADGGTNLPGPEAVTFSREDFVFSSRDPLLKTALRMLSLAWPATLSFDFLTTQVAAELSTSLQQKQRMQLAADLFYIHVVGGLNVSARDRGCASSLPTHPTTTRYSQLRAEAVCTVVSLHHNSVDIPEHLQPIIRLLDGTRNLDQIVSALAVQGVSISAAELDAALRELMSLGLIYEGAKQHRSAVDT